MSDALATMLGRIPSGLFILSVKGPDEAETGMLASWVQQASFEPPAVTVAVNSKRYLKDWLIPGAAVALSQIGETQKGIVGHFGKGFEPNEPAFNGLNTLTTPSGVTALGDALGWVDGTVTGSIESGDHTIYLIQLTSAAVCPRHSEERPWVHLRKNGTKY